jgi:crossover junction endodeoxyribonuclease RusA
MKTPQAAPPESREQPPCPLPAGMDNAALTTPCRAVGPICHHLELPTALVLITANERLHWARQRAITGAIRVAAATLARAAHIPPAEQAWITVLLHPHNRRRLDPHNWAPSAKAAIDGLVDARVLPDDDYTHLLAVTFVLGQPRKARQLALHITPVPPTGAGQPRKEPACPA